MPIVPVFSSHAATVIRLTGSSLVGAPVYDTNWPSGEKRPKLSPVLEVTCFCGAVPSIGTTHRWFTLVFFSSDTSITENSTHLPKGEICGSLTLFIAIRSAKVIGRLGAPFMTVSPSWVGFAAGFAAVCPTTIP